MNKRVFWRFFGGFTAVFLVVLIVFAFTTFFNKGSDAPESEALDPYMDGRKNVLIMGTDESGLRADVIMLASFSDAGDKVHVVSVPRDTRVKIGGRSQKINASLAVGGEDLVIEKVREVTGIPVHDYIKVNFNAVKEIVDKLGGIQFYVPQDMDYEDPYQDLYIHLKEGEQKLDGEKALQLLRFRGYPMADIQRTKVQRDFLHAAFEQKANLFHILKIPGVLSAINKNVTTTIGVNDAIEYAFMIKDKSEEGFVSLEIPYTISASYVVIQQGEMQSMAEEFFR